MVTVGSPVRLFSIRMKSQSSILMHLFIVLKRLLFLTTHLNAQWNGTIGHYSVNNNLMFQLSEALTFC